jgi:uncharacterized protein DUF4244
VESDAGMAARAFVQDAQGLGDDDEYAMGTIACAFAAVLYKVVTGGAVSGALQSVIGKALNAQF